MNEFRSKSFKVKLQIGYYAIVLFFSLIVIVLMWTSGVSLIYGLLALLVLMGVSFPYVNWLERVLTEPIADVSRAALNIAKGDFTQKVDSLSDDALGLLSRSFNSMTDKLKELLNDTMRMSKHVSGAGNEIYRKNEGIERLLGEVASSMSDLATGASQISEGVAASFSSVKEIEKKVEHYTLATREMSKRSSEALGLVEQGMSAVESQAQSVKHNVIATSNVSNTISELAKEADGIGKITSTIKDIAEQTNLLSLNASIEAARAGEHGRGFSVVAQEVRKLAEQSTQSAKEVFHLVNNIDKGIKQVLTNMEINESIVQRQAQSIEDTEQVFRKIVDSIQYITQEMNAFAKESGEMLKSTKDIASSMETISAITQESAAATEQVSASLSEQTGSVKEVVESSQEMMNMVSQLNRTIQVFKLQ
ncbi:methyl-accepting chemotaxis protein [Gorillibacterium sp. sgz5001074]|uniref:methyl-accepting chemotaxis protein n=1 Tax=Gorillibacterium sp. sgz5001074 TaxID=3446695 RepID=UPI003F67065F